MRIRRFVGIILLAFVAISVIASVGVVMPRTVRVVGPDGRPVETWAAYHYQGYRFGLVESLSYDRAGAIVRTDADGNIRLPGMVYLRLPIDGWLHHRIELLYAPGLHAATVYPLAADPSPRNFTRSGDGGTIHLADRTDDPEMWMRGFDPLFAFLRYDLMTEPRDVTARPGEVEALAWQMIADYRAFLERHAETRRTVPTIGTGHLQYMPEAEREVTINRIRADLAREPLWGPHAEQIWGKRIAELEREIGK